MKTRTSTSTAMIAATTARPRSRPLIDATGAMCLGAGAGFDAGAAAVAVGAGAGAERGAGVGAEGIEAGAAAAGPDTGAAAAAGAMGAGAGILIVGAAVGFGGKLIRTVSFLGCTFAASAGLGGTAPEGVLGRLSAINQCAIQARVRLSQCQWLNSRAYQQQKIGPKWLRPDSTIRILRAIVG